MIFSNIFQIDGCSAKVKADKWTSWVERTISVMLVCVCLASVFFISFFCQRNSIWCIRIYIYIWISLTFLLDFAWNFVVSFLFVHCMLRVSMLRVHALTHSLEMIQFFPCTYSWEYRYVLLISPANSLRTSDLASITVRKRTFSPFWSP